MKCETRDRREERTYVAAISLDDTEYQFSATKESNCNCLAISTRMPLALSFFSLSFLSFKSSREGSIWLIKLIDGRGGKDEEERGAGGAEGREKGGRGIQKYIIFKKYK
jgi:hypothetical protein